MNDESSWKRPNLERTGPLREWGTQSASAPRRRGMENSSENLQGAAKGASLGYEVSEEQMKEGKEYAQHHGIPGAGTDMFGLGGFGPMQPDTFISLSERLMKDAMLWFEFIAGSTRNAAAFAAPQNHSAQAPPAPTSHGFVSSIASQQPVELTFTAQPGAENMPLGVHALRAIDPDFPGISDVQVEYLDGQWKVSVAVENKQPAGLYTGIVFDREDGSIRGSLAVLVKKK
jgi:hypothetical protein